MGPCLWVASEGAAGAMASEDGCVLCRRGRLVQFLGSASSSAAPWICVKGYLAAAQRDWCCHAHAEGVRRAARIALPLQSPQSVDMPTAVYSMHTCSGASCCMEQHDGACSCRTSRWLYQGGASSLCVQVTFRTALDGPAFQGSGFSYTLSGMQHAIGPVSVLPTDGKTGFQPGGSTVSHAWGTPLEDLTHMEIELVQPTAVRALRSCR